MSGLSQPFRAARRAPWRNAAPLVIIWAAVLSAGLVVADGGGWSQVFAANTAFTSYGSDGSSIVERLLGVRAAIELMVHGAAWSVLLLAAVVAATAASRRRLTVALLVATGLLLAAWLQGSSGPQLGYVETELHHVASGSDLDGEVDLAITLYAVVGLLLGVAFAAAVGLAMSGARRRSDEVVATQDLPSTLSSRLRVTASAVVVTLVLPRVGLWVRDLVRPAGADPGFSSGDQSIYLVIVAMLVVFAAAVVLSRWRPTVSVASLTIGAALWFPAFFFLSTFLPDSAELLQLAVWVFGGLLGGVVIAARAGRAATTATPHAPAS